MPAEGGRTQHSRWRRSSCQACSRGANPSRVGARCWHVNRGPGTGERRVASRAGTRARPLAEGTAEGRGGARSTAACRHPPIELGTRQRVRWPTAPPRTTPRTQCGSSKQQEAHPPANLVSRHLEADALGAAYPQPRRPLQQPPIPPKGRSGRCFNRSTPRTISKLMSSWPFVNRRCTATSMIRSSTDRPEMTRTCGGGRGRDRGTVSVRQEHQQHQLAAARAGGGAAAAVTSITA